MSSDDYFDGVDDFDEEALGQLDAIEAAHFSPSKKLSSTPPFTANKLPLSTEDSFNDLSLDVNENELAQLDTFIDDAYQGKAQPVALAGPSNKLQTTLFGDIIQPAKKSILERTKSIPRNPFGQQAPKTKKWEQTAFAKSGVKRKAQQRKDAESAEDDVEFEQFPNPLPPPFVPSELLDIYFLQAQVLQST